MSQKDKKVKVLYLINGFDRGGAEKGLLELVQHGAFANCDLRILSIVQGQGSYINELRDCNVKVDHLFSKSRMSILDWALSVIGFWFAMIEFRPNLAILSLPQANIAARIAAIFYPRLKIASFEHNTHLSKSFYEAMFRLTSWRVDWMLADCQATVDEVKQRLYRSVPAQIEILPLVAISPRLKEPESILGAGSPFTIVNAGRFTSVKNQEVLIDAVKRLDDLGRDVKLILFGEGDLLDSFKDRVQKLGLMDRVSFPGFVPDWGDTKADAFVLTSLHEGLCIVAVEAMSRGFPIVGPRVGGLNDYGEDAKILLLDEISAQNIADAIKILMDSPKLRRAMSEAGQRVVKEQFSEAAVHKRYSDFSALVCRSF